MVLFKKALNLYQQTAALLVVLVVLTASIFYVVIGSDGSKPSQTITQPINSDVSEIDISYPCPDDPRCNDRPEEIAMIQETAEIQLTNCMVSDTETAITPNEREMFNLINNYRQQNGLSALSLSQGLSRAAAWLSHDMATSSVLSHTDSLGRSPSQRVTDCGYSSYAAENIAYNSISVPNATFTEWKNSPGHNANILKSEARTIGVAEWRVSGISYWTTDFGSSSDGNWDGGNPGPTSPPPENPTATPATFPGAITPAPSDAVFTIKISLPGVGSNQGTGENNNPVRDSLDGEIVIRNILDNTTIPNFGGAFGLNTQDLTYNLLWLPSGPIVPPGTYEIKTRFNNALWKSLGLIEISGNQTVNIPPNRLVTGDINQDNVLDLADYNLILACYGSGQCVQKEKSDLNLDGKVDEQDLNVFYSGLAKRQGD